MPHIITIEVYGYDELNDAAKAKARDWWRDLERQEWSWNDQEDAVTIFGLLGFETDAKRIRYSGFSCQGDGASFTGSWSASGVDVASLKEYAPTDERLHRIAGCIEAFRNRHPQAHGEIVNDPCIRYAHEYSVDPEVQGLGKGDEEVSDEAAEQANQEFSGLARRLMRWMYERIEADYEDALSDERIEEVMEANRYWFYGDGRRAATEHEPAAASENL